MRASFIHEKSHKVASLPGNRSHSVTLPCNRMSRPRSLPLSLRWDPLLVEAQVLESPLEGQLIRGIKNSVVTVFITQHALHREAARAVNDGAELPGLRDGNDAPQPETAAIRWHSLVNCFKAQFFRSGVADLVRCRGIRCFDFPLDWNITGDTSCVHVHVGFELDVERQ